jgi:hypothetical protein
MADIYIHYDYINDRLAPIWMIVHGPFDWRENLYIPIETPFKQQTTDDFNTDVLGSTVLLEDLIVSNRPEKHFSIRMSAIRGRTGDYIEEVELLIIQMSDIEDVLQMDVRKQFDWRI